ncbi:hypothetical protein GCM10017674_66770 [Streptomyces gardneri]|uniref:DDE Tnp4 domain-containing protein n=1 Tax=Streptomyces gardneri TaxID=66892 RepID=A0A4Y3RI85_9ACTN|nr:hypothetical protein SGA01_26840 [Streptomyces gardneri]GHH16645.1 hypothetical protein GCM10017674_66770 [Streptomyces gardneri]
MIDADTRMVVVVGQPLAGDHNDCKAWEESGAKAAVGRTFTIADGGYLGTGLVIPHRRERGPAELPAWKEEHNRSHKQVQAAAPSTARTVSCSQTMPRPAGMPSSPSGTGRSRLNRWASPKATALAGLGTPGAVRSLGRPAVRAGFTYASECFGRASQSDQEISRPRKRGCSNGQSAAIHCGTSS